MLMFLGMEEFVMGRDHVLEEDKKQLLNTILSSKFFEDYFRDFNSISLIWSVRT